MLFQLQSAIVVTLRVVPQAMDCSSRMCYLNVHYLDIIKWLVIAIGLCLLYRDDHIIPLSDLQHGAGTLDSWHRMHSTSERSNLQALLA